MTGAGSEPHRRQPMARGALFQQALQSGVTMRGPRPRHEIERRASDVPPGRDGSAVRVEIGEELLQEPVVLGADIEDHARPAGHDIGRVGLLLEDSRGGDEMSAAPRREFARFGRHVQDQPRRSEPGVATKLHRRRPGMVRRALEDDFDPGDADDRRDQSEIDAAVLEHDALLDMQLEVALDAVAPGLAEPAGIAADPGDRRRQGLAGGVPGAEHRIVERARHRAAADAGNPIFARLLGEKVHHLDRMARLIALISASRGLPRGPR